MTLVQTLIAAREAGATFIRDGDRLIVRGPAPVRPYIPQLLARKTEVLGLVDLIDGRVTGLDWRTATVGEYVARCVLCRRWSLLRDPYDHESMHKTCVEQALAPTRTSTAQTNHVPNTIGGTQK